MAGSRGGEPHSLAGRTLTEMGLGEAETPGFEPGPLIWMCAFLVPSWYPISAPENENMSLIKN